MLGNVLSVVLDPRFFDSELSLYCHGKFSDLAETALILRRGDYLRFGNLGNHRHIRLTTNYDDPRSPFGEPLRGSADYWNLSSLPIILCAASTGISHGRNPSGLKFCAVWEALCLIAGPTMPVKRSRIAPRFPSVSDTSGSASSIFLQRVVSR